MKDETIKALAAMACITVLVGTALVRGINGALLSIGIGILSGLGGYALGKRSSNNS